MAGPVEETQISRPDRGSPAPDTSLGDTSLGDTSVAQASGGRCGGVRTQAVGAYGERLAAQHLTAAGLVLLDRNFSTPQGEIDLLLRDGDTLVICEVKTRTSAIGGSPLEAVDGEKVARLRRLAAQWLECHPQARPAGIRLDLVGIRISERGAPVVDHVVGVG